MTDNNGRVGMLGISYPGWLTVMAMLDPHPALKAVSPQASPADMFLGDDFHHNGAFRLSYGFEYVAMMETDKDNANFKFDRHDTFEWYLKLGALSNVNAKYFKGKMPTWNDFVAHPNYDDFWKKQAFDTLPEPGHGADLNVAGWFDQEDFYGPLKIYELLEKHDQKNQNFLVVGPWNHGGWASGPGDKLGKITFDSATGKHFRAKVQAPLFARYLKDKGTARAARSADVPDRHQQMGGARRAGRRRTRRRASCTSTPTANWLSIRRSRSRPIAFDALRLRSGQARCRIARGRSRRPIPGPEWQVWMVEDQRFTHHRPDVLTYETEPLERGRGRGRVHAGRSVRRDERHRQRLDRAADRRLSGGLTPRSRRWAAISC